MNVSGIRRNIKNIAHNYTDAQVKVREATSNDPWGPPSSLMSEISDLTYNVVAFSEIMQMIWKRLNDHGKNYRHVYKALVLLDYLVKTGNEKVAQQCKENIFAIHTLRDFQYYEEGKDQGVHVREKSKALEALLKDDERLKNERIKALKARERFAQQTTGFGTGSDSNELMSPSSPTRWDFMGSPSESFGSDPTGLATRARAAVPPTDLDLARPQTAGEEELQLQLALAMSREEAEKEDEKRRSDDVRLALAISQSQEGGAIVGGRPSQQPQQPQQSHLLDLLDVSVNDAAAGWVDPWGTPAHPSEPPVPVMPPRPKVDAWGSPVGQAVRPAPAAAAVASSANLGQMVNDPWAPTPSKPAGEDPWSPQPPVRTAASANDPWSPAGAGAAGSREVDDFDLLTNRTQAASPLGNRSNGASSPFDLTGMDSALAAHNDHGGAKPKKSPESFLGPNSNLVNLENLVKSYHVPTKPTVAPAANPFALGVAGQPNPFQQQPAPRPSINELRHQQNFGVLGGPQHQQLVTSSPPQQQQQQLQQLQPMTGVLQPAPATGVWGPTQPMMQSGSGVTSPTFNPFLA
ncbi:epsin-2-like isoform X16 [Daphnia pulex]|uniref:epsin-2-like isoform X16 n=1 Tax=Daphnia pulex TaxID=6669 RepID=UPI001EDD432A|nr:epsin-2-like isoform X16 [Daphnia pulex]XP_046640694.1 epsin-2-like isoform X6 [Daphnia pulicaria]